MEEATSSAESSTSQSFMRETGESSSTREPEAEEIVEEIEHDGVVGMEPGTVIEEVVSTEQGYNEDGELVTYENVVVYDDGTQQILSEEYVDLHDIQAGDTEYAYVITDENGETRYLSAREVGNMVEHVEEVVHEVKPEPKPLTVPVSSSRRQPSNAPGKSAPKKQRAPRSVPRQRMVDAYQKSKFQSNVMDYDEIDPDEMSDLNDLQEVLPSYLREKFSLCLSRTEGYAPKSRPAVTLRDLIDKGLSAPEPSRETIEDVVYVEDRPYFESQNQIVDEVLEENKGLLSEEQARKSTLTHLLKVDVEKQNTGPPMKIKRNTRPMVLYHNVTGSGNLAEDDVLFQNSSKNPRHKKVVNPITHDEVPETATISSAKVDPLPLPKTPYVPKDNVMNLRFKCAECEEPFSTMERLCNHMVNAHDTQTHVRSMDFFSDRDLDSFLYKLERDCAIPSLPFNGLRRKTRMGSSQLFKCNFMSRSRMTNNPEMVEINLNSDGQEPEETCPAFVFKLPTFESIRVKFCDYHVHYDPNMGFRVPVAIKKRLFDMSYKRLPVPVMQAILQHEAEKLCTPGSKIEERIKNLSSAEIVDILSAMHNSIRKYEDEGITISNPFRKEDEREGEEEEVDKEIDYAAPIDSPTPGDETVVQIEEVGEEKKMNQNDEGKLNNEVESSKEKEEEEEEAGPSRNGEGKEPEPEIEQANVDVERVEEEAPQDERRYYEESVDIGFDTQYLYDPECNRDAIIEELTDTEMHFLEGYEHDIGIPLTLEQKAERMRAKIRYSIENISAKFLTLDSLTHGLIPNDMRIGTIEDLRKLSSIILDIACGLEAEIRGEFSHASIHAIKVDLISAVASRERNYNVITEKVGIKRKQNKLILGPERPMERDRTEEIMNKVRAMLPPHRSMGINCSGTFDITKPGQGSGENRGMYHEHPILEPVQRNVSPWYPRQKRKQVNNMLDPNPPKRRGRPKKSASRADEPSASNMVADGVNIEETPIDHVNITTDDNVPHAIAMGVDQEVEVSTEETIKSETIHETDKGIGGESADPREKDVEMQEQQEEEIDVTISVETTPTKRSSKNTDGESTVSSSPDTTTVTRTGRIVKKKKWEDS